MVFDTMQRPLQTLRISVTDQCNYRCSYCMPQDIYGEDYPFAKNDELLSFDEITRFVSIAARLGVRQIKLTGGEPLLRGGIFLLVQKLKQIQGIEEVALITNGQLLKQQLPFLKKSNLDRVTISLDSLEKEKVHHLTGGFGSLETVLENIEESLKYNFTSVKVNTLIIKGKNETEILPLIQYFLNKNLTLRFIEYMDVGDGHNWNLEKVFTYADMLTVIKSKYTIKAQPKNLDHHSQVGKTFQVIGSPLKIDFVTAVSQPFCRDCSRGRLSATGIFYNCLFSETGSSFKELLRKNPNNDMLVSDALTSVWNLRTDKYSEDRQTIIHKNPLRKKIQMHSIGG